MRSSDETDADGVGFGILEIWDGGDEGGCEDVEGVPTCSFGEFEVDERREERWGGRGRVRWWMWVVL